MAQAGLSEGNAGPVGVAYALLVCMSSTVSAYSTVQFIPYPSHLRQDRGVSKATERCFCHFKDLDICESRVEALV